MDPADTNAAETARIHQELEIEARRHKWAVAPPASPQQKGIIGWLISKKVVEEESQANVALLGVAIIAIVMGVAIYMWGTNTPPTPGPTQQMIEVMHKPLP